MPGITLRSSKSAIRAGVVEVDGLSHSASVGDRVGFLHGALFGEIIGLTQDHALVLPEGAADGLSIGAVVELLFRWQTSHPGT